MGLNKSKGQMYDWVTGTWNPLAGECEYKCNYCSTKTLRRRYPVMQTKYQGEYQLVEKEFKNLGKDKTWFVCAQNDLFGSKVPKEMVQKILQHCRTSRGNTYVFQTKNPDRYSEFNFPEMSIFGTTIETNRADLLKEISHAPDPSDRARGISKFPREQKTFVTIEPIDRKSVV
jgi:protein gp37